LIDHCQHVNLGCGVNYTDFCQRTGAGSCFRRFPQLHFFAHDGRRYDVQATAWLPAPLHLGPSLSRLGFLDRNERRRIVRTMTRLARRGLSPRAEQATIGQWLREHGESEQAIERFWSVVLVSALAETVDRISVPAAHKVFVDAFLSSRSGYVVELPTVPLNHLYDRVADWLQRRGVVIRRECRVECVHACNGRVTGLSVGGVQRPFAAVVLAVPWRRVSELLGSTLSTETGVASLSSQMKSSSISSLHLWFDRPLTPLPHAVLVGRLSQWVFARPSGAEGRQPTHYHQVVISASRDVIQRSRQDVCDEVLADLRAVFPAAVNARLLRWRLVNQHDAVFSVRPGIDVLRPVQATPVTGLFLAGDWTRTGWPATMEGAVRSGYLAAEAVLRSCGRKEKFVLPEPRSWLARRLFQYAENTNCDTWSEAR
jgi:squalene-associated FAD-dependent desaturase